MGFCIPLRVIEFEVAVSRVRIVEVRDSYLSSYFFQDFLQY